MKTLLLCKKYEMVIARRDAVLDYDKQNIDAFTNKENSLNSLGRYQEAINCYDETIQLDPNYAAAFFNKSYCYALLEKIGMSLEFLNQAISLDDKYKKIAIDNEDFIKIKDDERFKKLVYS